MALVSVENRAGHELVAYTPANAPVHLSKDVDALVKLREKGDLLAVESQERAARDEVLYTRQEASAQPLAFSPGPDLKPVVRVRHSTGKFAWVEGDTFLGFTFCAISANMMIIILQMKEPTILETNPILWVFEQVLLIFYLMELIFRALHFRLGLLAGRHPDVPWNWLDLIIVMGGVTDQWILPSVRHEGKSQIEGVMIRVSQLLRVLRVARMAKIIRVLMVADFQWAEGPIFQVPVALAIVLNGVTMGLETDIAWGGWYWIEQSFCVLFCFELVVRLKHHGWKMYSYSADGAAWNWLDSSIVISSVTDQWIMPFMGHFDTQDASSDQASGGGERALGQVMMLMRMLRLLRILRLLRLVKGVRPLYNLAMGVTEAMQGMFWVLVFSFTTLYAVAILATRAVSHGLLFPDDSQDLPEGIVIGKELFSSVPESMFALFRIMNGDRTDVAPLLEAVPALKVFFVFFTIVSSWALSAILTAVLSETMTSVTAEQNRLRKLERVESKKIESRKALKDLFAILTANKDADKRYIEQEELQKFLEDQTDVEKIRSSTGLEIWEVQEVFDLLSVDRKIAIEVFLDALQTESKLVSERSVMRLEHRLRGLEKRLDGTEVLHQSALQDLRDSQDKQLKLIENMFQLCELRLKTAVSRGSAAADSVMHQWRKAR